MLGSYVTQTPNRQYSHVSGGKNPHVVYRAFAVAETPEDRVHSAELENWRGALQAGSEEDQKKKKEEKKRKVILFIFMYFKIFSSIESKSTANQEAPGVNYPKPL